MRIVGVMNVRNEEVLIERCLRYHLDTQGFDIIMVLDNGSYDKTPEIVQDMNDPRIQYIKSEVDGYSQDRLWSSSARSLFEQDATDWFVPMDADEMWFSTKFGTTRKVLERFAGKVDVVIVNLHQLFETELDNQDEPDPFKRVQYAKLREIPRVVAYRLGNRLHGFPFGAHWVILKNEETPKAIMLAPEVLSRTHYNRVDELTFMQRVINQAEGYILRFGEDWLSGNTEFSPRVLREYNHIKAGTFHDYYRKKYFLDKQTAERLIADDKLHRVTDVSDYFYGKK